MPLVSEFFGIRIHMYWNDRIPPQFHAEYGGTTALIGIEEAVVLRGTLPFKQLKLVVAWCELHRDQLMKNWNAARRHEAIVSIDLLSQFHHMTHRVIQAYPTADYHVYVYFGDGVVKRYSVSHLVGKGVFKPLSDVTWYLEHCTVLNGTLAWDPTGEYDPRQAIDIDPDVIYDQGETVEDPLAGTA